MNVGDIRSQAAYISSDAQVELMAELARYDLVHCWPDTTNGHGLFERTFKIEVRRRSE